MSRNFCYVFIYYYNGYKLTCSGEKDNAKLEEIGFYMMGETSSQ